MATHDERIITEAIRRSDVCEQLLIVRLDPRRARASARFRTSTGDYFTVEVDGLIGSSPESTAASLIAQARAKLAS